MPPTTRTKIGWIWARFCAHLFIGSFAVKDIQALEPTAVGLKMLLDIGAASFHSSTYLESGETKLAHLEERSGGEIGY
ncbi:hypothetical protein BJ508DRAFT_414769 [Ascobolus immersus RN42]|uniref:Uncharacterized protein n=1 Tax=Ascobolus immersus RN42 TaxID=1160509 RepID=A0A3N4I5H3_ASCIM|nr:hypothetical protein BJ508DRAFT_414769 [Ascobolus immersus RN42]